MQAYSPNDVFIVSWDTYRFSIDRKTLKWSLSSEGAAVPWVTNNAFGYLEILNPETGIRSHGNFSDCTIVSLSEKMNASGKRLLLSLDTPQGLPLDVYFTCGQRELRITLESNRSTSTARIERIVLLQGLMVSEGSLVLPFDDGVTVSPQGDDAKSLFECWENEAQVATLFGPWVGMIGQNQGLLITALSVYASVGVARASNVLECWFEYAYDPDHRHIDVRFIFVPEPTPVRIAMAYRDLQIKLGAHRTLSQKQRARHEAFSKAFQGEYNTQVYFQIDRGERSRWGDLDALGSEIEAAGQEDVVVVRSVTEWSTPVSTVWIRPALQQLPDVLLGAQRLPLWSVIWRDAVIGLVPEADRAARLRVPCVLEPNRIGDEDLRNAYKGFGIAVSVSSPLVLSTDQVPANE